MRIQLVAAAAAVMVAGGHAQLQQPLVDPPEFGSSPSQSFSNRHNIVFIITDDQDLHLDSLQYQPLLKEHLSERGTSFTRHYCTVALCCPSRVSLWTGKAAHNTNVTDIRSPYGGYPKFISQGLNDDWLPVWLRDAGYNTYYTGKLFNEHTTSNFDHPFPKGFTGSDFLLDPFTYQYLNSSFQRNQDAPKYHPGEYSPDLITQKAYGFIDDAMESDKPFFLGIAPPTPHSNMEIVDESKTGLKLTPPIPAERHQGLFQDAKVPRTYNFNPEESSGVSWVRDLSRQTDENVDFNDHFYRQRLRSLQTVDEMVEGIVKKLDEYGVLDTTYIIYTTDNGYHIGQHRLQPGKSCGFEEDVNIPLIIRGPGVPKNYSTSIVTTHTDMAPTILDIAGVPLREDFDGVKIPLTLDDLSSQLGDRHEHVNIEHWGFNLAEGKYGGGFTWNNTYKALRVAGEEFNLYYSVYCNNEHEFYDLSTDPGQMNNLLGVTARPQHFRHGLINGFSVAKVAARLDALLLVLKSCKGDGCVRPWLTLHPDGSVVSLFDALDARFDDFYEKQQVKVSFDWCDQGYISEAEGPEFSRDGLVYRDGYSWDNWV